VLHVLVGSVIMFFRSFNLIISKIISPENSMEENCQTFTKTFIEIVKNCVPKKEVTIRLNDKVFIIKIITNIFT
jgi:hypothetical protein